MAADPVSWFLIEPGWKVIDRDGSEVGRVQEVAGDPNLDIFDGLAVSSGGFGAAQYVPAEQVAEITEGCITLALSRAEVERLAEFTTPPANLDVASTTDGSTDRPSMNEGTTPQPGLLARIRARIGL